MQKFRYCLIVCLISSVIFSAPSETSDIATNIEGRIESAFGSVERNSEGEIIGFDLARDRASATDDLLQSALSIPHLKRFRFAGGNVAAESLSGLLKQHNLEELYLQDVPLHDADWKPLLDGHPKLTRLTLRRLPNLSAAELGALPRRIPALRNLALIDMALTGDVLTEISKSEVLTALDVRNCSHLTAEDYRCLTSMSKLADLKIGGFGITDDVMMVIVPCRLLRGLTIDDALITPTGLEQFTSNFASAEKLESLVFSRNSALFDDSLISLKRFPNLKRLTVNGMMVTGSFLEYLAKDEGTRPKLQRLSLRKAFLSESGAAALKKYPELRILDLSGVALTPELIEIIVSLDFLEELDAADCGIDDGAFQRLKSLPSLKRLTR